MEDAGGTASLRKAAAHWSLAGDRQLLGLLQNLHERIVSKCQEANSSLDEMVNTLDTASISLQNVNNRLMALSNSQFVESRVYDDDVDVAAHDAPVKEPPKPAEPSSELSRLRESLRVLEAYHEPVHIVDSDSDSVSDEEEERMVFKPRDLYAERPLPYVIGSQQWRSKWHAGLVAEESDTDSDTSKANPPSEQYSDSEPEREDARTAPGQPHVSQRTISTNSSIGSELTIPTVGKPADIAAELARRLGGNAPRIPEPEPESPPTAAVPPQVYRPQQPTTATIFADEPPPLDEYQSDHSDQAFQSDSENDVFAELHRDTQRHTGRAAGGLVDQLFENVSNVQGHKGVEDHVDKGRQPHPSKQPSPLFDDQEDSELFADKSKSGQKPVDTEPETSVKKPVGGISLFGNNRGAESIGAAILKRNQRKGSTSDEEVEEPRQINKVNDYREKGIVTSETGSYMKEKNQKDIINDLFSKSNKTKPTYTKVEKIPVVNAEKSVNKKVDLFTDDLFDDIDDIFTNVKPPPKETMKKSLFDDEDDDLFANVASASNTTSSKAVPKNIGIFDSDDDLFGEENVENNAAKLNNNTANTTPLQISNDGLFSSENDYINKGGVSVVEAKTVDTSTVIEASTSKYEREDNGTIIDSEAIHKEVNPVEDKSAAKGKGVRSIFESDSDDDIFSKRKNTNNEPDPISRKNKYIKDNETNTHSAIDDDVHAELISSNNSNNENKIINDESLGDDSLFKRIIKTKVDETVSAQYLTPQNKNDNIRNNLRIDQFEDNNKNSEHLTESIEKRSEIDSSAINYPKDKLLSTTNKHDDSINNKKSSTTFNTPNLLESQYQSPSLFDDDELDDMFSKIPDSEEIDNKQKNSISAQSSEHNEHIVNKRDYLHTKEINEAYTTVISETDIANKEPEVNKSDKYAIHQNIQGIKNISTDLRNETGTNLINSSLQETEAPVTTDRDFDYSKSVGEVLMREEMNKNKTEYVPTGFKQKESLLSNVEDSVSGDPDIFSDIFSDIPPEFERPKEPKRSKNVNALFDDDSDDEALFFKKNEIITDEKPDVSFTSQDDGLFHIFHDEPPAMDVDFTQKPKKNVIPSLETQSSENYSENIHTRPEIYKQTNVKSLLREETHKQSNDVDPESERNVDEAKKPVRKLKTMNFNINVSTLLPGASPKKTKGYEQVDGQVISTKRTEDIVKEEETKMVKSVSFDGDPESEILDNKASKERARIQVKRRPSSRRARKEAVRKSGIDFGDDSTDNSSSTDISKKDNLTDNISPQAKEDIVVGERVTEDEAKSNNNILDCNEFTNESLSDMLVEKIVNSREEPKESKLFNNIETYIGEHTVNNDNSSSVKKEVSENCNLSTAFNKRPNVKSKVVYILNDEDIFTDTKPIANLSDNTQKQTGTSQSFSKNKVLNVMDDDDELFKSGANRNTNISTIGNVYKDVKLKNTEIDNFDSNEDIFIASQSNPIKHTEFSTTSSNNKDEIDKLEAKIDKLFVKTQSKVKSSLFDDLSDDESELFGSKKSVKISDTFDNTDRMSTVIKKEVKLPKHAGKRPLFSDESDNDNLFAVTTVRKVSEPSQSLSKPKEVISKPSEPVFEDPLSLLGQEDDM